jgi:hypothetical protein
MKWLAECSVAALREALSAVAPELAGYPVTVPGPAGKQDPLWHSGCVPAGDQFFVKFAWSRPAALRLAREIAVLAALAREPEVPFLPEVVASSADPLLMITRRVPGASLFEVAGSIDPDHAARQLVRFLAALHHPAARRRAEAAVGTLTGPQLPPATTTTLRDRLGTWIGTDQLQTVAGWCDWADAVLESPAARPCSCTATCTATTRCGTATSSGWCWTSRTSGPPSPNTSYAAFPVRAWVPASSC